MEKNKKKEFRPKNYETDDIADMLLFVTKELCFIKNEIELINAQNRLLFKNLIEITTRSNKQTKSIENLFDTVDNEIENIRIKIDAI